MRVDQAQGSGGQDNYHLLTLSEPKIGRFVTLQKIVNPDEKKLNWAEVRVESSSATADLEQEETLGVFLDSAIM